MSRDDKSLHPKSGEKGKGRRKARGSRSEYVERKKLDSNENVPMLTFGAGTNFATFQEALSVACLEKYGDLGRLIKDDAYYEPPYVMRAEYLPPGDEITDPEVNEAYKSAYTESVKQRIKDIAKMKSQRSSLYAYIHSKLSVESENEVEWASNLMVRQGWMNRAKLASKSPILMSVEIFDLACLF